jgi:hypothetical protein
MVDDPCDGHPAMMGNILIKIQRIIICHVILHILIMMMMMSMVDVVVVFMVTWTPGRPIMGVTTGGMTPYMAHGYTILGGNNHFI